MLYVLSFQMKHDVIPNQISIEVSRNEFNTEFKPPWLLIDITLSHSFGDRRTQFVFSVNVKYKNIWIVSDSVSETLPPAARNVVLDKAYPIMTDIQRLIESEREGNKEEDLRLDYILKGFVQQINNQGNVIATNQVDFVGSEIFVSLSEWKDGLGLSQHSLVPIAEITLSELENLRKKWGLWRVEEVISKFIDTYNGKDLSISHQALLTFQDTRTIRDKISDLVDKSGTIKEVRVTSPYLDNTGSEYLIKLLKNKAIVKIITRKGDTKKAQDDALHILKQLGAEVKYDKMMHSRIIIFDDLASIVSSADLDSEGLNNQKQAGVYSTDRTVNRDLIVYFDKCWDIAAE